MKLNINIKKITCLFLAVLMLLGAMGCQDSTKKKKKKVIVEEIVIVHNDNDDKNPDDDKTQDEVLPDASDDDITEEENHNRPVRKLPDALDESYDNWQEPVIPEFDYDYATLNITKDYVIVYSFEKWDNRKESAIQNSDGTLSDRYVNYTGNARISAYDLREYFKEKLGIVLDVKKDTEVSKDAKKILVGNTAFYTSKLSENKFAVKVRGDDLIFEGGHWAMVTKAAKWFETVEVKKGKVATLSGTANDFKSQVTLGGITYDYVWGDECDGYEFINSEKWSQSTNGDHRATDYRSVLNNPDLHFVENGKMRLTSKRYFDEGNPQIGYASSGDTNTETKMNIRNGYFEFRARIPYQRGAFPAIWTMSWNNNRALPNYNYDDGYGQISKAFWTIEFDLMESFGDTDHSTTTLHKWYNDGNIGRTIVQDTPVVLTDDEVSDLRTRVDTTGIFSRDKTDANGNVVGKEYYYYPIVLQHDDGTSVDIFKYRKRPFLNMNSSSSTYQYSLTYPGTGDSNITGVVSNGKYDWTNSFDPETLNNEYHIYALHYTSDHCTVLIDGNVILDFDWDPTFDYLDFDGDGIIEDVSANAQGISNNGVGFNLWHYFILDSMIYTPNDNAIGVQRRVKEGERPLFNLYIDWVRCYQDLDDPSQALWYPNGEAD